MKSRRTRAELHYRALAERERRNSRRWRKYLAGTLRIVWAMPTPTPEYIADLHRMANVMGAMLAERSR